MKFFKLMMIAFLAMLGLNSCSNDSTPPLDFIEVDYSKDLVGTWTYIAENGQAEAMVIKEDGSFAVTGIAKGGYLYEEKGTIKVENNKVSLVFEGDSEVFKGRLELVVGKSMSIVFNEENDIRLTYDYCKEDLSDEVIGMWVCTYVPWMDADMAINVYQADGKAFFTGFAVGSANGYDANIETTYKVIGNLMFQSNPWKWDGAPEYLAFRLNYSPNGSEYGDVLTNTNLMPFGDEAFESTASMIRIKQNLNLVNRTYDYISAYVSNAKGTDEDFTIMGHTFNMSKIEASNLDMMFRSILSCIELNENSFKYKLRLNGNEREMNDPISVEGNKVVVDMSATNPACRKVEMYMFQDADDCQLHIYMPTKSFINYFANLLIPTLVSEGKLDTSNADAVEKVFADMESRIESINVSLVYKARK